MLIWVFYNWYFTVNKLSIHFREDKTRSVLFSKNFFTYLLTYLPTYLPTYLKKDVKLNLFFESVTFCWNWFNLLLFFYRRNLMRHFESDVKFVISSLAEKDLLQSIFIIFKTFLDVAEVLDLLIVVVCSFILEFLVFQYSRADILTDCRKYRKFYTNIFSFHFLFFILLNFSWL